MVLCGEQTTLHETRQTVTFFTIKCVKQNDFPFWSFPMEAAIVFPKRHRHQVFGSSQSVCMTFAMKSIIKLKKGIIKIHSSSIPVLPRSNILRGCGISVPQLSSIFAWHWNTWEIKELSCSTSLGCNTSETNVSAPFGPPAQMGGVRRTLDEE